MKWIKDGLRFECTGCGSCCRRSGYVWVTVADILDISERLGLDPNEFGLKYLIKVGSRYSLGENSRGHCILLGEDGRCSIYDLRPQQCKSFPFWRSNLKSRKNWEDLRELSPGIDQGRLYPISEILGIVYGEGAAERSEGPDEEPTEKEAPKP